VVASVWAVVSLSFGAFALWETVSVKVTDALVVSCGNELSGEELCSLSQALSPIAKDKTSAAAAADFFTPFPPLRLLQKN